jgi:hypothetical protein
MWRKRSGEVALAGEDRTGRDRKVESRSRMALRRDEKAGAVERRRQAERPNGGCRSGMAKPRGDDAVLGGRVAQEA